MDLNSGYPFWAVKSGLLSTYPRLENDLTCEVVVIGGGISGALIAHYLTEANIETVVLEKREIAGGSTSASTALLQYEIDTPLTELVKLVGEQNAVRAYQLCRDAIDKVAEVAQKVGVADHFSYKTSLYLASRRWHVKQLRQEYELRKAKGFNLDFLEKGAISERFSFSAPAALYSYNAGEVDAFQLAHGLFRHAAKHGAQIFDRTSAKEWQANSDGVTVTTDTGCRIHAKYLILAAGYEAQNYIKQSLVKFRSSYAIASELLSDFNGWYEQCLIWESARPYVYMRTTSEGRAIIGGEDDRIDIPAKRDALLERKAAKLSKRFNDFFPHIPLHVDYRWAGTFGETSDGLPYIDHLPDQPRILLALGYGGNGITYSIVAAELLRDRLCQRPNPDAAIFRLDRH
ncbi:NAD(P)/FAD-dependent oxidoreductase [Herpetosiphon geysericola]|uniref:FAD-dependent oxidoreductase n=1 Tax=Herpetosiphon geysericola TaxID=70996 RepID=A0A0P6Y6C7_9CHLR|nr:FAD-dependent oxidoreductase [Herpetosiphon geysericola]KPL91927.1 FAD-dependent oxidoreductase [Herpetosiphon geysericola]